MKGRIHVRILKLPLPTTSCTGEASAQGGAGQGSPCLPQHHEADAPGKDTAAGAGAVHPGPHADGAEAGPAQTAEGRADSLSGGPPPRENGKAEHTAARV